MLGSGETRNQPSHDWQADESAWSIQANASEKVQGAGMMRGDYKRTPENRLKVSAAIKVALAKKKRRKKKANDYDANPSAEQMVYKLRVAANSWHEGTIQGAIVHGDIVTRLNQAADMIEKLSKRREYRERRA
jgi:hypothetical protein